MKPSCPCHECEERFVGCHGSCEKYAEFRKEIEFISKEHQKELMYSSYCINNPGAVAFDKHTFRLQRRREKRY